MPPTALIDFPQQPAQPASARLRLAFDTPTEWLVARQTDAVRDVLDAAQEHARCGRWCVGWVSYEAASAFDPALRTLAPDVPLAVFAVFDTAHPWPDLRSTHGCSPWRDALDAAAFASQIHTIQEAIRKGEVYQVNLSTRMHSQLEGNPLSLFDALRRAQPGGYALYLRHDDLAGASASHQVLSVSPELFFDWRDGRLLSQPMKGTAARGASAQSDAQAAQTLLGSDKERAENLMIVDLLRNDFARIATLGSVKVPRLFELHALPTVWQMTSTIEARTRHGLKLSEVFGALFPCGSVTGAPKVSAMKQIALLEATPRGVYCGAAGVLMPGGAACFNVPIRSVELRGVRGLPGLPDNHAQCGIGSGITLDSTVAGEAAEWRHKRRFLERAEVPFELLESMRLQDGVIWLLDHHLLRLHASAQALGHAWPGEDHVRLALMNIASQHARGAFKLRLLLDAEGRIDIQATELDPDAANASRLPLRTMLAGHPIEANSDFVRHKTTHRRLYSAFAPTDGYFDTLLWNAQGELTEFTIGNLAMLLDGQWQTPASACGLLAGTYRQALLDEGALVESRLTLTDLQRADAVAFINSVRGWMPVHLELLRQTAAGRQA